MALFHWLGTQGLCWKSSATLRTNVADAGLAGGSPSAGRAKSGQAAAAIVQAAMVKIRIVAS